MTDIIEMQIIDEKPVDADVDFCGEYISGADRYDEGFDAGFNAGVDKGFADGREAGYTEGKQAEYDRFWDTYQQNGNRTNYETAFAGEGWTNETFKPKYSMQPINTYMMFRNSQITGDFVKLLEGLNITLDISKCRNSNYMFYGTKFERLGVISCISGSSIAYAFAHSTQLKTIDKLILNEAGSTAFTSTFDGCSRLENITVEGAIGNNISLHVSPLTVASMNSIISCLKDYSATGGTHTLTFKADRETMLTDEEKAAATGKGWTLVWN